MYEETANQNSSRHIQTHKEESNVLLPQSKTDVLLL